MALTRRKLKHVAFARRDALTLGRRNLDLPFDYDDARVLVHAVLPELLARGYAEQDRACIVAR